MVTENQNVVNLCNREELQKTLEHFKNSIALRDELEERLKNNETYKLWREACVNAENQREKLFEGIKLINTFQNIGFAYVIKS